VAIEVGICTAWGENLEARKHGIMESEVVKMEETLYSVVVVKEAGAFGLLG
jgi:hypothetical protein